MALPLGNLNDENGGIDESVSASEDFIIEETPENSMKSPPPVKTPRKKVKTEDLLKTNDHKWSLWLLIAAAVLIVVGLIVGLVFILSGKGGDGGKSDSDLAKEKLITESITSGGQSGGSDGDATMEEIDGSERDRSSRDNRKEKWTDKYLGADFSDDDFSSTEVYESSYASSSALPSEKSGYTSDLDEILLPDGTYNPDFSYLTQENVARELSIMIESLSNPYFGGWENAFLSGSPDDLFREGLEIIYLPDSFDSVPASDLPVFIDWSGGRFGFKDAQLETRVNSIVNDFTFDEGDVKIHSLIDITVKGRGKDNKVLEKDATIDLRLVSNPLGEDYPRVLIENGTLKVG